MSKPFIMTVGDSTYYNGVEMPHVHSVSKYEYMLDRNWTVTLSLGEKSVTIWIKAGFKFDGASIPRALWRLCGHPLEAPRIAAALAHDWLYRAQVTDREIADDIFNILCKRVGMACWRTGPEYYALRLFGWAAWRANHEWPLISEARALGSYEIKED
jgi:hypothetical protein